MSIDRVQILRVYKADFVVDISMDRFQMRFNHCKQFLYLFKKNAESFTTYNMAGNIILKLHSKLHNYAYRKE